MVKKSLKIFEKSISYKDKSVLVLSVFLSLIVISFIFYNLSLTGKYLEVDIISPYDNFNYTPGEIFNLTLNVSCLNENCDYVYVGIAKENVTSLYVANGGRGLDVLSESDSGMISIMHNVYVEEFSLSVWGDGEYIYSADGDNGISVFKINSIGKPEFITSDNRGGYALSVWGDGNYIYLANEQKGLEVYTMGEEGLTHLYNGYREGGFAYGVWGDGDYIYVADGILGVEVYKIDENGLTFLYNDHQEGGYALSVWGDGNYIYLADEWNGIEVYSINESGLTHLYNHSQEGGYAVSVWGDGDYIYVADGARGIEQYTINENGLTFINNYPPKGQDSEAYYISGDKDYIYLADGENGVEVYSINESGLTYVNNYYEGGYSSSLFKQTQNGVMNSEYSTPFFIQGENYFIVNLEENKSEVVDFVINTSGEMGDSINLFGYSYLLSNNNSLNTSDTISLSVGNHPLLEDTVLCESCYVSKRSGSGVIISNISISCTYDYNFDWGCTEWSNCTSGEQTRDCVQVNNCGTLEGRPQTQRVCELGLNNPDKLFDIRLDLLDKILDYGDKLESNIRFESFGTVPTYVDLSYRIIDSSGREIYYESGNITVTTEQNVRNIFDTSSFIYGNYTLVLKTVYGENVTDEFRQNFEIRTAIEKQNVSVFLVIVFVLIISCLVAFIAYKFKKNKK